MKIFLSNFLLICLFGDLTNNLDQEKNLKELIQKDEIKWWKANDLNVELPDKCPKCSGKLDEISLREYKVNDSEGKLSALVCEKDCIYFARNTDKVGWKCRGPFPIPTDTIKELQAMINKLGSKKENEIATSSGEIKKFGESALEVLDTAIIRLEQNEKDATEEQKNEIRTLKERIKKLADEIIVQLGKELVELFKKLDEEDAKAREDATNRIIELGTSAKQLVSAKVVEIQKKAKEANNKEVEERCKMITYGIQKNEKVKSNDKWIKEGLCQNGGNCGIPPG